MKWRLLALPIAVLSATTISLTAAPQASAAEPFTAPQVTSISKQVPPGPCSPNWVRIFGFTKQPQDAWKVRINGTDLQKLVNDTAGKAFITIDDADGSESLEVGWDEGHPLSVLVTGCYGTYNLKHRTYQ